jgi:arginyl-tRNA synthetase
MNSFLRPFAESLAPLLELSIEAVAAQISRPPRPELGQLAFPCFALAKSLRKAPNAIAADLAERAQAHLQTQTQSAVRSISAEGPYVNAFLDGEFVAREVLPAVLEAGADYGCLDLGQGAAVTVDFSSPNIAKSFGIHHLRSTVIGHALVKMLAAAGYRPVGINHLGDWGTQFGQLLVEWNEHGDEQKLAERGIDYLLELYVGFNTRKDKDPSLQDQARERFKALEDGDPECRRLWTLFRQVSLDEFERVYALLDIQFDDLRGESFYEHLMPAVLDELQTKGLLRESEGATVIDLSADDLGVALVRKADGSTLYLTRDLASAEFRKTTYDFVRSLYVVGGSQSLHFDQMKKVLELMGRPWHADIEHVPFGLMRFKDRKMASRKGDIVHLAAVLQRATELARQTIVQGAEDKGRPVPDGVDRLAHEIGVGAVVFNDLKNRRVKDVTFDWDDVLAFDGETGPYLQYTAARIASMEERHGRSPRSDVRYELLDDPGELALVLAIGSLSESLERGVAACEPSLVADKLLEIASKFSTLYSNREWKVLSDDRDLTDARMLLAHSVRQALCNGLGWLGIAVPERM